MTYFLDFDRTLFDNARFFPYLAALPALSAYRMRIEKIIVKGRDRTILGGAERGQLWKEINAEYSKGLFSFASGELTRFVFPDVFKFLDHHGRRSVVVTSGGEDPAFQKGKIASAGITERVQRMVLVVAGDPKGPALKKVLSGYEPPYYFVDDLTNQLDSVAAACPEVLLFEMSRDTEEVSGKYPVIRSLLELP